MKTYKVYLYENLIRHFEIGDLSVLLAIFCNITYALEVYLQNIGKYLPLNLKNFDYQFLIPVFAMNLQRTLDKLINRTQTGYIKGRFMSENSRSVLDIFD